MKSFVQMQEEIIILNKNGISFLLAASICWIIIGVNWFLPNSLTTKVYVTFFASAPMLPQAFLFSKLLNTSWQIEGNPLNKLGLWLNFAQLFYFPFIFIFLKQNPEQMVMALAIITGAHFFPYAWFYQSKGFAVFAGIIAIGSSILGTNSQLQNPPLFIALLLIISLWVLTIWSFLDYRKVAVNQRHRQKEEGASLLPNAFGIK